MYEAALDQYISLAPFRGNAASIFKLFFVSRSLDLLVVDHINGPLGFNCFVFLCCDFRICFGPWQLQEFLGRLVLFWTHTRTHSASMVFQLFTVNSVRPQAYSLRDHGAKMTKDSSCFFV